MSKRRLLTGLPVILAVLLLSVGCAPAAKSSPPSNAPAGKAAANSSQDAAWAQVVAAAQKEGKVTLYTWGVTGTTAVKMQKAFKAAYGIEMETVTGVVPTLIERMKTEAVAGKDVADTFDASASSLFMVKDAGLSQPIGNLPALAQKKDFRQYPVFDPEGHLMAVGPSYRVIIINSDLVKPADEPKSYRDLLDPKWKGKIVLPSPVTAVAANVFYAMKDKLGLDDDYFRKLAKNEPIIVATDKDAADMIARGEAYLSPAMTSLQAAPAAAKGAPIKGVLPKEGTISQYSNTWALLKKAPHPNAAKVLLNWLMLPEGQKTYSEAALWTPMRSDLPDTLPPSVAVPTNTKFVLSDIPEEMRVATYRTDRTVAKLMGIEK